MNGLKKMLGGVMALALLSGVALANNDDLATMKAAMSSMQAEMEAMRANMAAERDVIRSNAGGTPESLRSANGNASIRIGGDFRVQYGVGWSNGYGRADNNGNGDIANFRSTSAGWAISRAQLQFDIDLSCDTSAVVDLRLNGDGAFGGFVGEGGNILNQAYWRWNNVGGSGFGIKVGLMDIPFGMWANTENGGYAWDSIDRPLITKPLVMNARQADAGNSVGGFYGRDNVFIPFPPFAMDINPIILNGNPTELTNFGIFTSYNWDDQLVLQAGLMAASDLTSRIGNTTAANDPGLTYNNEQRNIGFVDHVITASYNPCWLEGLHLEAGYMGQFDDGRFNPWQTTNPYNNTVFTPQTTIGDHIYRPSFDVGVVYKFNDAFKAFAEAVVTWNPYYSDGFSYAFSAGADFALSEKLLLGAAFEMYHLSCTNDWLGALPTIAAIHSNLYRVSVGAKYNFGNGVYFQAQYYHDLLYTSGIGDQNTKNADVLLFQTGYTF